MAYPSAQFTLTTLNHIFLGYFTLNLNSLLLKFVTDSVSELLLKYRLTTVLLLECSEQVIVMRVVWGILHLEILKDSD